METMAAPKAKGKKSVDVIFGAAAAAKEDAARIGQDQVTNGTIGAIMGEDEKIVCLPTVGKVLKDLSLESMISYAPIAGIPAFRKDIQEICFGKYKPNVYSAAISTVGGTGGIHHMIQNYTEEGDEVLTSDWYWGAYKSICTDNGRKLRTYHIFDENLAFNKKDFEENVRAMAEKQRSIAMIINSPAHNPTGYAFTEEDWSFVLSLPKDLAEKGKKIIIFCDVAYIDFAGFEARKFFLQFNDLPKNILVLVEYSMSKSFTMYGLRSGALIGLSSSAEVIQEFEDINSFTSRATWSNTTRAAQETLVAIWENEELRKSWEAEKENYYTLIKERAAIFTKEAEEVGLPILPYKAGFFLSIPSKDSAAVCNELHKEHIYLVPLAAGVRVALCGIPKAKVYGMAKKIKEAMVSLGEL